MLFFGIKLFILDHLNYLERNSVKIKRCIFIKNVFAATTHLTHAFLNYYTVLATANAFPHILPKREDIVWTLSRPVLTALARKTALTDDERGLLYPSSPFLAAETAPRKFKISSLFAKRYANISLKLSENVLRRTEYYHLICYISRNSSN